MILLRESGNEATWETPTIHEATGSLGMRLLDVQEQIHLDMLPTDLINLWNTDSCSYVNFQHINKAV